MTVKLPLSGEVMVQEIKTAVTSRKLSTFDVNTWLTGQSEPYKWLLAHTYQGVIWGRRDPNGWQLSSGLIPNSPPLETHTLLELRLFAETAEIYLWRDGMGFRGRWIEDDVTASDGEHEFYDEPQILWGTKITALKIGFTLLQDGSQGLAHVIPCASPTPYGEEKNLGSVRPATLLMRHYVIKHEAPPPDDKNPLLNSGLAVVAYSRLVAVSLDTQKILEVKNGTQA